MGVAMMTTLEKIKIALGILAGDETQDPTLSLLLADTEADLMMWTNRSVLPLTLEPTLRQLAIMRYNKVGIEGQTSHSEGGVSRSFDDLPLSIRQSISRHVLVKVVGAREA